MGYVPDANQHLPYCGCWFAVKALHGLAVREYMPQIDLTVHTTILSTTSKTVMKQTFINSSTTQAIDQASYTFPLYAGVSVVSFECQVGTRIIRGLVKEKEQARADYTEAISRGETAGLLEQLPESSDVFTTRIGNIPAEEKVIVEITYLGELKHDAEVDGVRFTIPTAIAPRYGILSNSQVGLPSGSSHATDNGRIEITVDIQVDEASFIRGIQSPSHPIGVTLGRTSVMAEDSSDPHRASATLSLRTAQLEKDFVLLVLAKDQDIPRALLETHLKFPNQRALLATLVPSFHLPPSRPEIVFVVDRSGSMRGNITTVISAVKVFLKSLPVGVKFNICSFGSSFSFLWPRSKSYDKSSLDEAFAHVSTFAADFGGTDMLEPVVETVSKRYTDMQLEVMLLTDGQIWQQQALFDFINETVSKEPVRFFSLGVGASVSHSLVEGIARAGNGFAQFVGENEKLDKKVVRMVKGALTPHITDYTLEVKYEDSLEEGYEMVEKVTEGLRVLVTDPDDKKVVVSEKPTISLFDPSRKEDDEKKTSENQMGQDRYSHLPTIAPPKLLQAPSQIPPLYPFIRASTYLLMSSEACQNAPKSVVLRATSQHGPLELEIPVQDIGKGETIHQLAAKKAMTELEEGRGWIVEAKGDDDKKLKDRFDGRWDEIVEQEAVRLGVNFQVGGKWCSFVAVQRNPAGVEQEETDIMPRTQTLAEGASAVGGAAGFGHHFSGSHGPCSVPTPRARAKRGCFGRTSLSTGGTPLTIPDIPDEIEEYSCDYADYADDDLVSESQTGNDIWFFDNSADASLVPQSQTGNEFVFFGDSGDAGLVPQSQTGNEFVFFGDSANAGRVQTDYLAGFGSYGLQYQPANSAVGAFANLFQVPAEGSVLFGSQPGGVQADHTSSLPELSRDALPARGSSAFVPMGAKKLSPHKIGMDVDVKAHGIVGDNWMRRAQVDAGKANEFPWQSQGLETPVDRMHALIALQGFDGSWGWSDELLHVVGLTKEAVTSLHGDRATMATVLAIAFLESKVPGEKDTWELVVEKARGWLEMRATDDVDMEVEKVATVWV